MSKLYYPKDTELFQRMSLLFRVQHIFMFLSVFILMITGFPLKYHSSFWGAMIIQWEGGVVITGRIHHFVGKILIFIGLFHIFYIIFSQYGRNKLKELLPSVKDFSDCLQDKLYSFRMANERPMFKWFTYFQKIDYWASFCSLGAMSLSGLILLFSSFLTRYLPKVVLDISQEIHSNVALLAVFIIILHLYNVHFSPKNFPFNWVWWTGQISKDELLKEYPLVEYENILEVK